MKHIVIALSLVIFVTCIAPASYAQEKVLEIEKPATLAAWQQLSGEKLREQIYRATVAPLSEEEAQAAQQRAVSLLRDSQAARLQPYPVLTTLLELAGDELSDQEKSQLLSEIQARKANAGEMSMADLMHYANFQRQGSEAREVKREREIVSQMVRWLQTKKQDVDEMEPWQLNFLLKNLSLTAGYLQKDDLKEFSVTWDGQLTPPRSGEYVFSPCAFDINVDFNEEGQHFLNQQTMTVRIGEQQAFKATPEQWNSPSTPIALTAGKPVSIQVSYRYVTATGKIRRMNPALAILYWKGPGIERSVVPAAVFKQPDGKTPGLSATYQIQLSEKQSVEKVVEPNIEHVWQSRQCFIFPDEALPQELVGALWQECMAANTWEQANGRPVDDSESRHWFVRHTFLSQLLSCEQRAEFLQRLTADATQMQRLDWDQARTVFAEYQYGAEQEAIEFLGRFLHEFDSRHEEPVISQDYYHANGRLYRWLSSWVAWLYPPYLETLESEYLELDDGSVCLPVAHLIAQCRLQQGDIQGWISLLDEKLADKSLTGDRRVSWLIARARAEEIRRWPPSRFYKGMGRLSAGWGWLDEAMLIAESPVIVLRVVKERATRLAARYQWEAAQAEIKDYPALASWQEKINQLKADFAAQLEEQKKQFDAEILAELKHRQAQAARRGNQSEAVRYTQAVDELQAESSKN